MQKTSLTALARNQLDLALAAPSGRSSKTVHGGHERALRQTVIALRAGESLAEHQSPSEATVYVLQGRVVLATDEASWSGWIGDLIIVPPAMHRLDAVEDCVILLTVVMPR